MWEQGAEENIWNLRVEVSVSQRQLHNEVLHDSDSSPGDQIKEGEIGGACIMRGEDEKCIKKFNR
jgi:hypothetical protein